MNRVNDHLVNWASILEPNTLGQAVETARMSFIWPHLALMPDAHLGMGATVGSVIPTLGAIIPSAVGVDIGCGMIALRLKLKLAAIEGKDLRPLRESIEAAVPSSAGKYNQSLTSSARIRVWELETTPGIQKAQEVSPGWELQLGSLGGGNHFIEVCVDEEGYLWLFLHSGSRGVGNRIAQHHIKIAKEYCKTNKLSLPNQDLAYLVEGTAEFDAYIRDLRWAQKFALLNREEMMHRVFDCFVDWLGVLNTPVTQRINCHHNYTEQEEHYGSKLWVSRKGAIDAHEGVWGLIPGSMGTASYVVVGKGNPESLCSSPHGAGRVYSRSKAKQTFTHEQLVESMVGIEWRESDAFLDEIPGAYKSIDQVMEDAYDLVEVRHELHQIVNVKGQ